MCIVILHLYTQQCYRTGCHALHVLTRGWYRSILISFILCYIKYFLDLFLYRHKVTDAYVPLNPHINTDWRTSLKQNSTEQKHFSQYDNDLSINLSQASFCDQISGLLQPQSNCLCYACPVMPSPVEFLHHIPLGRVLDHHAELVTHTCPKTWY